MHDSIYLKPAICMHPNPHKNQSKRVHSTTYNTAGNFCYNYILCCVFKTEVCQINVCNLLTQSCNVLLVKNFCGRKVCRFPRKLQTVKLNSLQTFPAIRYHNSPSEPSVNWDQDRKSPHTFICTVCKPMILRLSNSHRGKNNLSHTQLLLTCM